ncbi:MAG TPA: PAS domain S-box protein, partial [Bacteroidota bacterium]|nr:PAS domain S-box protein [Bacteroidota bacterium]
VGASPLARALFGYAGARIAGTPIERLIPAEPAQGPSGKHLEARAGAYGESTSPWRACAGVRKDGSSFPAEIRAKAIPRANIRMIAVRDLTEQSRLQDALRESEARYRALVELSPEAIIVHSLGMIIYVNQAAVRLFMASSEGELIGRSLLEIVPDEYVSRVRHRMEASPEELEKEGPLLIKSRRKDGQEFYIESIASRITYQGQPASQVILRDTTDRVRAYEELQASREQLRNLSTYLQSAREAERASLAREIHDELGGSLTALKFDIAAFEEVLPPQGLDDIREALRAKVEEMSVLIDGTVQTMRRIITQLRPVLLDSLGLVAAIEWHAEDFEHRTGIPCGVTIDADESVPDPERATAVYRIFQETLTNVARHANATRVTVHLTVRGGTLTLNVSDNGKGVAPEQLRHPRSFGIIGMQERALIFGGSVVIENASGGGTSVLLRLPLERLEGLATDRPAGGLGR